MLRVCLASLASTSLVLACTGDPSSPPRTEPGAEPAASEPKGPTRLVFALPAGVRVAVDGRAVASDPPQPVVVEPGAHAVVVETPCGDAEVTVEADGRDVLTIGPDRFPTPGWATLEVAARDREGKPRPITISVGRDELGSGPSPLRVTLASCAQRVTVSSEGLGSYIEDLEPEAGATVKRSVVLAPGPSMVRIQGARFRTGPPGPSHYDPAADDEDVAPGTWPWIEPLDVEIATFDLDQTEVTAQQYQACRLAGACAWDPSRLLGDALPTEAELKLCTIDIADRNATPRPGMEELPLNCTTRWQAEAYCAWAGKRLPTDLEWELAARSRRPFHYCPAGPRVHEEPTEHSCRRREPTKLLHRPCTYPDESTAQGVCDMMSNVSEFVERVRLPGRAAEPTNDGWLVTRGASNLYGRTVAFEEQAEPPSPIAITIGFRCARDVAASPAEDEAGPR